MSDLSKRGRLPGQDPKPERISENAYPFIKELLLGGDDLRHIVDEISGKAQVFNPGIHSDDVTVIGVRVTG